MGSAVDAAAEELRRRVAGPVVREASLAPFTSYRLGGPAAILVEAATEEDLVATAQVAADRGLEVLPLGRGSNVLVSDHGFPGVVIRLGRGFDWIREVPPGEGASLDAGGAARLARIANWAARRGLSGMEFAVAIPASLGGAVRMNAGAHGSAMSSTLVSVRCYHLGEPGVRTIPAADLGLAYRSSRLGPSDLVCAARLVLAPAPPEEVARRMAGYREHRAATQPVEPRNAGSMFQNPPAPQPAAGRLIEDAGLKGFRVGGAEVSRRHANFFVARAGATAADVHQLIRAVQSRIAEATGVTLLPEVKMVGRFEESAGGE